MMKIIKQIIFFIKGLFRGEEVQKTFFLDSNGEERRCGGLPSPPDDRDYEIDRLLPPQNNTALPREFNLVRPATIRNQGNVGSCTAFTIASAKEILELQQSKSVNMSPGFIYGNRSGNHRHSWTGSGMWPRDALTSLRNDGTPRLEDFPYNIEVPDIITKVRTNMARLRPSSFPFRISAFARLNNINQIKQAIVNIGPVPIVYTLFESFNTVGRNGIVPNPNRQRERQLGGHAMLVTGWRVINGIEYWIVVNSWGPRWGDNGLCYIETNTARYRFDEAWSVTDNILPARRDTIQTITFRPHDEPETIVLDGNRFVLPTPILMREDRTFVPLRFFSEALGCHVQWNDTERKITISRDRTTIVMWIGRTSLTVNGSIFDEMEAAPFIVEPGFTMVPIRFVSEHLNSRVDWDTTTRTGTVTRLG